jgi:uncharacterized protein YabN with tetrapyrrole methylase and pyrophosphatase domain
VSAAIIAGVVLFLSSFQSSLDSTTALAIVKTRMVEKLNGLPEVYSIVSIQFSEDAANQSISFAVKTSPAVSELDVQDIIDEVKKRTKYKNNVQITVG